MLTTDESTRDKQKNKGLKGYYSSQQLEGKKQQASARFGRIEKYSNDDGEGNGNVKKAIKITKTTTLRMHYTFWYVSLSSLHD